MLIFVYDEEDYWTRGREEDYWTRLIGSSFQRDLLETGVLEGQA